MKRVRFATAAVVVTVAGLLVAAGALPGWGAATTKAGTVTIKNLKFSPSPLTVKAGAKITVKNADSTTHTFTADKGAFDTGRINGGKSASVTIKKPGTYAYHCEIHNFMNGTIKAT